MTEATLRNIRNETGDVFNGTFWVTLLLWALQCVGVIFHNLTVLWVAVVVVKMEDVAATARQPYGS